MGETLKHDEHSRVVRNMESDEREILGEYVGTEEDTVSYRDEQGEVKSAPADCVSVELDLDASTVIAALTLYGIEAADPTPAIDALAKRGLNREVAMGIIEKGRERRRDAQAGPVAGHTDGETVHPDGTVTDALGNFAGIDQPGAGEVS